MDRAAGRAALPIFAALVPSTTEAVELTAAAP
jgi:hypothetical protein